MYDIPFDRSFLQLSNGIRHVTPSTDRKLELTAKALMAQPISQPAVCSNGLSNIRYYNCNWTRPTSCSGDSLHVRQEEICTGVLISP